MMGTKQTITKKSPTLEKINELRRQLALAIIKNSKFNEFIDDCKSKSPNAQTNNMIAFIDNFGMAMEKNLLWCLNDAQNLFNAYKNKER